MLICNVNPLFYVYSVSKKTAIIFVSPPTPLSPPEYKFGTGSEGEVASVQCVGVFPFRACPDQTGGIKGVSVGIMSFLAGTI